MTLQVSGGLPAHLPVLVVGAGFGGIGAAVALTRAGHDVLVLERAGSVGGTWRDNGYPGCACDVPSHLYSFSFAPNPGWTRAYSSRAEILTYLEDVVTRHGVRDRIRCGVEVRSARWDDAARRWRVRTSAGDLTADVLVGAGGALSTPHLPALPGLDAFTAAGGRVLHTGRWDPADPATDLTGLRVAVVGTGASAVQLVPQLAGRAAAVTVLQRTPPWILPRHDHAVRPEHRDRYARHPLAQRLVRSWIYARQESTALAFVNRPALMGAVERTARRHLRAQVPDPGLRALLTPDYRPGCKRLLLSDDYYPALQRDDVELVASAAERFGPGTVVAADGARREIDAVVFATGFEATAPPFARCVTGRDGRTLAEVWAGAGMRALRGTTVHGFPNLFLLTGPNTGLGHTSMVAIIESQLAYLVAALAAMQARGLAAVEPVAEVQQAWNETLGRRLAGTVWATGGCASWYQDDHGRITTLWPGSATRFRLATRRFDLVEYRVVPRAVAR